MNGMLARPGFTLIELLVVMSIMATMAGLILSSGVIAKDKVGLRVDEAAKGVERKLLEARGLAIATGEPHAVVFHIENAPVDAAANLPVGRILRNGAVADAKGFPGRHWCAVIAPWGADRALPRLGPGWMPTRFVEYGSAQRFAATVEKCQVGDRYYLPHGTRFLALGDAEDNIHTTVASLKVSTPLYEIGDWSKSTAQRGAALSPAVTGLNDTYPRPWFGFLSGSGTTWTMNAWGGYDTAINGSGLDYECTYRHRSTSTAYVRMPVTNNANAAICSCWKVNGRAETPARNDLNEELRPCCDASQVGTPRPLVNGYWMDFAILFMPNGQSLHLSFYNRCALYSTRSDPTVAGHIVFPQDAISIYGDIPLNTLMFGADMDFRGRDDGIIHVLAEAVGGASVTIARDADPASDDAVFPSPEKALASLLPLRRVLVNERTGGVRVVKPYASIQAWLDDMERGLPSSRRIWENGFEFCTPAEVANAATPNKIRVTGALTPEMLQQHDPYPWIKPKP